jgi:hypothetical protein
MYTINQRFEFLDQLTKMVIKGQTPSLIVTGEGGLGKTHAVTQAIQNEDLILNDDYIFIKGYSTARGLYNALYDNNNRLIVYDDCDSILEDKVALNILKSALDSYDKRTITWATRMNRNDEYPQQFDFTGRIIFISNKSKESMNEALITRSLTVDLSMTPDDKITRMGSILSSIMPEYSLDAKIDALKFLTEVKDQVNLNIRMLIMVTKMRVSFPENWKDMAKYMIKG